MHMDRVALLGSLLAAGLLVLGASPAPEKPGARPPAPQEVEVSGVLFDPQSRQPLVVLEGKRDRRTLVLAIGPFEANGIAVPLQGVTPPRPLTHDLILTLLADLKASLARIVISDLRNDVYYALLYLDVGGSVRAVDARPSDAIALALRAKVPILVEDRVFDKAERLVPRPGASPHF